MGIQTSLAQRLLHCDCIITTLYGIQHSHDQETTTIQNRRLSRIGIPRHSTTPGTVILVHGKPTERTPENATIYARHNICEHRLLPIQRLGIPKTHANMGITSPEETEIATMRYAYLSKCRHESQCRFGSTSHTGSYPPDGVPRIPKEKQYRIPPAVVRYLTGWDRKSSDWKERCGQSVISHLCSASHSHSCHPMTGIPVASCPSTGVNTSTPVKVSTSVKARTHMPSKVRIVTSKKGKTTA
jgi:hypothetical protein